MMYIGGLGVFSPIPKRLAVAYPKLAVYLFVLGGPMLFLALLVTLIWLVTLIKPGGSECYRCFRHLTVNLG
jgi:hypothetical protein